MNCGILRMEQHADASRLTKQTTRADCHIMKNTQYFEYKFSQLFGYAKMFQFVLSIHLFPGPSMNAPLSWCIDGIAGQMNIQSNSPFHVDNGNTIYEGVGCRLGQMQCH
jgi:hypothetical protein